MTNEKKPGCVCVCVGGSTSEVEEEGGARSQGVGVEVDGSGRHDCSRAMDDGVLASEDDLTGRAIAYLHWFPIPRHRACNWIHDTGENEIGAARRPVSFLALELEVAGGVVHLLLC